MFILWFCFKIKKSWESFISAYSKSFKVISKLIFREKKTIHCSYFVTDRNINHWSKFFIQVFKIFWVCVTDFIAQTLMDFISWWTSNRLIKECRVHFRISNLKTKINPLRAFIVKALSGFRMYLKVSPNTKCISIYSDPLNPNFKFAHSSLRMLENFL